MTAMVSVLDKDAWWLTPQRGDLGDPEIYVSAPVSNATLQPDPADFVVVRDPYTRQTIAQRYQMYLDGLKARQTNETKSRGKRSCPIRKRGDYAKHQRIERDKISRTNRNIDRVRLLDQLDELTETGTTVQVAAKLLASL